MSIHASDFEYRRCGIESATRPMEPPWRTLAALLLLAGRPLLHRCVLPAPTMTALSGAFNRGR
ncbi:MAG: hypothetical protein O9327_22125 [Polaromonas sp.]|nr:hypothetical protein [Polaromonas sp.]